MNIQGGHDIVATGRKRRKAVGIFVVREPTGRLSRTANATAEECSPAQIKRLRDAALSNMCDPEWGSELGRLYLTGRVHVGQFATGKWFGLLSAACRKAIDVPTGQGRSTFVERTGGHPPDPNSQEGRKQAEKDREAVQQFMEAHAALLGAGKLAEHAVRRVCEDDQALVGYHNLLNLRHGLDWLTEFRRSVAQANHGK